MHTSNRGIELTATRLRQMAGVTQIPINIEAIVTFMGGMIKNNSIVSETKVIKTGDSFTIFLADEKNQNKKKFLIAHKIGHIILHSDFLNPEIWPNVKEGENFHRIGTSKIEYEANDFATELLIPSDLFRQESIRCQCDDYIDIVYLSKIFDISIEAVKIRGYNLGLFNW